LPRSAETTWLAVTTQLPSPTTKPLPRAERSELAVRISTTASSGV